MQGEFEIKRLTNMSRKFKIKTLRIPLRKRREKDKIDEDLIVKNKSNSDIENHILSILKLENRPMPIREINLRLEKDYDLKYTQDFVKRNLEGLRDKGEIIEE